MSTPTSTAVTLAAMRSDLLERIAYRQRIATPGVLDRHMLGLCEALTMLEKYLATAERPVIAMTHVERRWQDIYARTHDEHGLPI